jgi:hypothetical protein
MASSIEKDRVSESPESELTPPPEAQEKGDENAENAYFVCYEYVYRRYHR